MNIRDNNARAIARYAAMKTTRPHSDRLALNGATTRNRAVQIARRWLLSHGHRVSLVVTQPDKYRVVGYRSPTCSPLAWFGNAAQRRAICEITRDYWRPTSIIVASLRAANPHPERHQPEPDYEPTPFESRRRVWAYAQQKIGAAQNQTQYSGTVDAWGRYHACPGGLLDDGARRGLHKDVPNISEPAYEREMVMLEKLLRAALPGRVGGYTHLMYIYPPKMNALTESENEHRQY